MSASLAWRNQKILASGALLLLTSLFGPFLLRKLQRRRHVTLSHSSISAGEKPSIMVIERPLEDTPQEAGKNGTQPEVSIPSAAELPQTEWEQYHAFISQLPAPTLTPGSSADNPTTVQPAPQTATTEGVRPQRMYKESLPSGEVRTVIEQHHDFGNGRFWRRKLVVYSG